MNDLNITPGRIAYEAYCAKTGWKSLVSGAVLPQWGAMPPAIAEAWEAAADAVVARVSGHGAP